MKISFNNDLCIAILHAHNIPVHIIADNQATLKMKVASHLENIFKVLFNLIYV